MCPSARVSGSITSTWNTPTGTTERMQVNLTTTTSRSKKWPCKNSKSNICSGSGRGLEPEHQYGPPHLRRQYPRSCSDPPRRPQRRPPSVRFYPNSVVPMLGKRDRRRLQRQLLQGRRLGHVYLPSDSGFFDTYDALLTQHGFVMIGDSNSDDLIYRNASQKQGLVISIMAEPGRRPPW